MSWQPSFDGNRDILYYQIYKREISEDVYDMVDHTPSTEYVVNSLEPYTQYKFKILACNVIGCTPIAIATPTDTIRTSTDGE